MEHRDQLADKLQNIAEQAARSVGPMLAEAFAAGVTAREKGGFDDLVTEFDPKSERMIIEQIMQAHPDSMVLGEEGGHHGNGAVRWYVDPIDGTTNFAGGIPFFCVSIGAEVAGQMVAGVVYDPLRQEMFSAGSGGTTLNGQPVQVKPVVREQDAVVLTNIPNSIYAPPSSFELFGQMTLRFRSVRRLGAIALELAYLTCGRADVVVGYGMKPWDLAAVYHLIARAGGRYHAVGPGEQPWLSPGCVACSAPFRLEESILVDFVVG
ncbi:MAG: inositol monophosphatase family protein [Anaerolineae bacterium]